MSPSRGRQLGFAAVTAALGLGLVLGIGELMARAAGYRVPAVYDASGSLVQPGPIDGGGGPFRGVSGTLYHFDFEVPWINNAHGFRERELAPKAPGEWRIGFFGDSFAAGYGVEVEERISDQWFEAVRDRMPGATLWNLGANNSGAQHQADVLLGVGSDYALDEVILLLYSGNEGSDDLRWEREQEARSQGKEATSRPSGARRGLRAVLGSSRLAMLAWTAVGSQLARHVSRSDAPPIAKLERFREPVLRALDRFQDAVGERPLTIWYLPSRMEWDDEHWAFMKSQQGLEDDRRDLLRAPVVEWASREGVPLVDLTPALLHRPAAEVRFPVDGHYNADTHRRMAELAAQDGGAAARLREGS